MKPTSSNPSASSERLSRFRSRLLFDHPFLTVLALSLSHGETVQEVAVETDGTQVFLCSELFDALDDEAARFTYLHVLLHIILRHPARRNGREEQLWNLACDLSVNLILDKMKRVGERPEDQPFEKRFEGLGAEAIYAELLKLPEDDRPQNGPKDLQDPPTLSPQMEEQINAAILQAATLAHKAADLPGELLTQIESGVAPRLPFEPLLESWLRPAIFDRQSSYARPNRRHIDDGLYLPGPVPPTNRLKLVVAVDASASIEESLYARFLGAVESLGRTMYEWEMLIVPFDSQVIDAGILHLQGYAPKKLALPKTDGGTSLDCVFDYLQTRSDWQDGFLIVLTDGHFATERRSPLETLLLISDERNLERHREVGRTVRFE